MSVAERQRVLLNEVRTSYLAQPELAGFAPFPQHIQPQQVEANIRRSCTLLQNDTDLIPSRYPRLHRAILDASSGMHWRQTYPDGQKDTGFMDRWGCFSIIGEGGPFAAHGLRVFVVYMPRALFYPWHRHPAEEMYLVISGRATFKRPSCADETLTAGQTMYHASDLPHAIETTDCPVLCLVAWRTHLNIAPVLVPEPACL